MISIEEVDRFEALYADGQKAKAITEARELALRLLPRHMELVSAYAARDPLFELPLLPRDLHEIEAHIYYEHTPDDVNAARAIVSCAKWLLGRPQTRTEGFGAQLRRVVVKDREDFAADAFVALRAIATPTQQPQEPDAQRRLRALRAMGGSVTWRNGQPKFPGISKLVAAEKAAGRPRSDEKTIRDDLRDAAAAERDAQRQGQPSPFAGLGLRR